MIEQEGAGIRRLARNSAAALVVRVSSLGARLVITMILARYLGKALFGDYNYVTALVGSFELLSDFGLNQIAIREIARHRGKVDEYFGNVLTLKFFMMLSTLVILIVVANNAPGSSHVRLGLYLYGASVILSYFVNTYLVLYRAFEEMQYEALLILIERGLYVLLMIVLVHRQASFVGLFWANVIAVVVKFIAGTWLTVTRFTLPEIRLDWVIYKKYVRETLPVGIGQIVDNIGLRVDIVLLGFLKTSETVGIFSGPYRIIDAVGLMSIVLITALFPLMSRRVDVGRDALRTLLEKAVKVMVLLAAPASIGLAILARPALLLVLGDQFAESEKVLQLLTLIIVPVYLNRLFSFAFIAINRQIEYAYISGTALLLNVIVDLILIPSFGYWGACIGAISAEIARLALCYWRINHAVGSIRIRHTIKRVAIPSLAMAVVLLSLVAWSWIVAALAGATVFLVLIFLGGTLDQDERGALRQALG